MPIKLQISIDYDDANGYVDEESYSNKAKELLPVKVFASTDYAEALEYGTGPLKDHSTLVDGGSYTWQSIYNELYEWAGKKESRDGSFPIRDKKEREAFAKNLTGRFWHYGMTPHPYFRPAIAWFEQNAQALLDKGLSMQDIAEETVRIIMTNLKEGDHIFNGQLLQSIGCETLSYDETKELSEMTDDEWEQFFQESGWNEDNVQNP